MAFSQGGAKFTEIGLQPAQNLKKKKDLKDAIKNVPGNVQLYSTSAFDNEWSGLASEIPEGLTFNVVGPDPYTDRNWYASVKRNSKGAVTVS